MKIGHVWLIPDPLNNVSIGPIIHPWIEIGASLVEGNMMHIISISVHIIHQTELRD